MSDPSFRPEIGIGATDELNLRVSVAALVRVLFEHPRNGRWMLALERRATLCRTGLPEVKAQPFGGALRIHDLTALQDLIGDFHFDSEHSRAEQDFRLFIRPSDWGPVQQFCLQHFKDTEGRILEVDPERELAEEFADTLNIALKPGQYADKPLRTLIEDHPAPTESLNCKGYPTARLYRIFEAQILDASISHVMLASSAKYSDHDLAALALKNAHDGGPGWANTILTLPLTRVTNFYSTVPPASRNAPVSFEHHQLDETVAAILEVDVPKYQKV